MCLFNCMYSIYIIINMYIYILIYIYMWHTYIYNYLHVCANLWMWIRWVTGSCSALPLLRNWSSMNLPKRLELSFLALRNTDVTWNTWCHICHLNHNEDVLCWGWFGFCVFWCFIVVCWPTSFLLQYPQKRLRLSVRAFPNASSSGLDSSTCFSTCLCEKSDLQRSKRLVLQHQLFGNCNGFADGWGWGTRDLTICCSRHCQEFPENSWRTNMWFDRMRFVVERFWIRSLPRHYCHPEWPSAPRLLNVFI